MFHIIILLYRRLPTHKHTLHGLTWMVTTAAVGDDNDGMCIMHPRLYCMQREYAHENRVDSMNGATNHKIHVRMCALQ